MKKLSKSKKFLTITCMLLTSLVLGISTYAMDAKDSLGSLGSQQIEGTVFYNVPQKNWTSMSQVNRGDILLNIHSFEIENNKIYLEGSLNYDNEVKEISIKKNLLKSKQSSTDVIAEINSKSDDQIRLVNLAIRDNVPKKKLLVNKKVSNKNNVLFLYLFDEKTNNLIMFEDSLNSINRNRLNYIRESQLKEALTDTWEFRVVNPKIVPITSLKGYKDDESRSIEVVYDLGWGQAVHSVKAKMFTQFVSELGDEAEAKSTLVILPKVTGADGSEEEGWSNITAGYSKKSVEVGYMLEDYRADNPDYITKLYYGGNWQGSRLTDLYFTLGYGPINGSIILKRNKELDKANWKNILPDGDGNYCYEVETAFDGAYLRRDDKGSDSERFECNVMVTRLGDNGMKKLNCYWTVPFYDKFNSDYLKTVILSTTHKYTAE